MKLLLVFVEGEHDVVFVERSLRVHERYQDFVRTIDKFPSPLGGAGGSGVLARQLLPASDKNLVEAKRPPLPRLEAAVHELTNDTLCLVLQMKGVTQLDPVVSFLNGLINLLAASQYDITNCATAIVVDADDVGVAIREAEISRAFAPVFPGIAAPLRHGVWQKSDAGPVGLWVFHDSSNGQGTLEALLLPIVQAGLPPFWDAAESFIDGLPRGAGASLAVDRGTVDRFKAVLTAAGQFKKPGAAMHGMLGWNVLDGAHLLSSPASQGIARFLAAPTW